MTVPDEPTKHVRVTSSWSPVSQSEVTAQASRPPRTLSTAARGAAAVPLTVMAIVNLVGMALVNVPELRFPVILRFFGQFGPLVSPPAVTFGANTSGTAITTALVGAIVLVVVTRSGLQNSVPAVGAAAALTAVPFLIVLVGRLGDPAPLQRAAAGLLLGVLALGSAVSVPVRLARGGAAPTTTGIRFGGLFALYVFSVVIPYAIGRAAGAAGVVAVGPELWHPYVAGAAIGTLAWAFAQVFPPLRLHRLGVALVVAAVALGPLLDLAAGRLG